MLECKTDSGQRLKLIAGPCRQLAKHTNLPATRELQWMELCKAHEEHARPSDAP